MNLSRFLASVLFSATLVASSANATTVTALSAPDSGSYEVTSSSSMLSHTFANTLAAYSKLTVNYTYDSLNPVLVSISAGVVDSGLNQTGVTLQGYNNPFIGGQTTSETLGSLPVIITANLSQNAGSTIIENRSGSAISFSSIFSAYLTQVSGKLFVSYSVAAVPLPAAAWMLISALMMMAGFAAYKKQREQM